MTTIHAEKQNTLHFPTKHHDSVYKKGVGWLLCPDAEVSGLKIIDGNQDTDVKLIHAILHQEAKKERS